MDHIKKLDVLIAGKKIGTLTQEKEILFQYSPVWIESGFNLSPTLDFNTQPQKAKKDLFEGLHGPFHDSLPDGWGLFLMDRALQRRLCWRRGDISILDRLAYISNRGMGALEYKPSIEDASDQNPLDLDEIAKESMLILSGEESKIEDALRIQGGSAGGARPKVTIARSQKSKLIKSGFETLDEGFEHWIVKFRSEGDLIDAGNVEHAYSIMAKQAGVNMPETDLIEGKKSDFFAIKRFDRELDKKLHMLSLGALLYANFRLPCLDYKDVLTVTASISKNRKDVEEVFKRMVFNILSGNRDDHVKNFAYLHKEGGWKASPAFDITMSASLNNEHMTSCMGAGRPTMKDALAMAENFRIEGPLDIIEEVEASLNKWSTISEDSNVSKNSKKFISSELSEIKDRFFKEKPAKKLNR